MIGLCHEYRAQGINIRAKTCFCRFKNSRVLSVITVKINNNTSILINSFFSRISFPLVSDENTIFILVKSVDT